MEPYNAFAPCPKCDNAADDIEVRFCTNSWLSDHGRQRPHRGIDWRGMNEHLDRYCKRCGYCWVESCIDAKEDI